MKTCLVSPYPEQSPKQKCLKWTDSKPLSVSERTLVLAVCQILWALYNATVQIILPNPPRPVLWCSLYISGNWDKEMKSFTQDHSARTWEASPKYVCTHYCTILINSLQTSQQMLAMDNNYNKSPFQTNMVGHAFNPSTQEVEAGGLLWFWG